jgi:spore coat polysaccharide biosynthesis predicted glycosyltransferase SpsG
VKLFPLSRALDSVAAESGTVISNAGTSLWKFIALRKPTGMIKMAKNQDANFDYATRNGLAVQIADFVRSKEINTLAMLTLVSDVKLRETLISNQSKYIANQNMPQLVENILNFGDS